MISVDTERLVDDYMQRLASAAGVLPKERRAELVSEIRFHVADALRASDAVDEVDVRNVLDRIGTPEEIVAAAIDGQPATLPAQRFGTLEVAAVLILGLGGFFFPIVGWLVGVVLVWISDAWSTRDKLIGTAAPFVLIFLLPALFMLGTGVTSGGGNFGPTEMLFITAAGTGLLGGVVGAIYLAARLSVATRAEHKRRHVLKIALGIALGGMLFLVIAGAGVIAVRTGSGPVVSPVELPQSRAPITAAQYDNVKIGESTHRDVVAMLGEPLATCTASGCKFPEDAPMPTDVAIGVNVPVDSQCIYYSHDNTDAVYTLCFDSQNGKLLTKSTR